jgi:hypothetical protein
LLSGTVLPESYVARGQLLLSRSVARLAFAHKFVIFEATGPSVRIFAATIFLTRTFAALEFPPVFSAAKLSTGMFTALEFPPVFTPTKLSSWKFTAFKFPAVLTTTRLPAGIFATFKFPTILPTTRLGLWGAIAIALIACAATIVMSGCIHC